MVGSTTNTNYGVTIQLNRSSLPFPIVGEYLYLHSNFTYEIYTDND